MKSWTLGTIAALGMVGGSVILVIGGVDGVAIGVVLAVVSVGMLAGSLVLDHWTQHRPTAY